MISTLDDADGVCGADGLLEALRSPSEAGRLSKLAALHLLNVAMRLGERGDFERAWRARRLAELAGTRAGYANVREEAALAAGTLHELEGALPPAIVAWHEALDRFTALRQPRSAAASHVNLGSAYRAQGELDIAAGHLQDALAWYRDDGDRAGEAAALINLGLVREQQGATMEASRYWIAALATYRLAGDEARQASCLSNLGMHTAVMGELAAGAAMVGEALALCRKLGDRRGEAMA